MSDKWKGDGTKWLTEGLFHEVAQQQNTVLYTINTWDKKYKGVFYPSLHNLYVDMMDVAEFNFANKYFGNYEHWLLVKSKKFFQPYYAAMVEELNAKLKGLAMKNMLEQLASGEATQSTLKYLADNDFIPKLAGRPSKLAVATETKRQATLHSIVNNDLARIR